MDRLRETAALARSLTPGERDAPLPPPRVWDAIVTELAEGGDLPAAAPPGPAEEDAADGADVRALRPRTSRGPWPWLAIAAAVVLLAVVGVAALVADREDQCSLLADTTLEPLAEVEAGTAHLLEGPEGLDLVVETAGLPEADGYYALWLIDREVSRLVSLGPLDEGRHYRLPGGLDIASFPVVDVSLEPFDGDPGHSGNSVLRGVLPLDVEAEGDAAGR